MTPDNRAELVRRLVQNEMGMVELHATWVEPRFTDDTRKDEGGFRNIRYATAPPRLLQHSLDVGTGRRNGERVVREAPGLPYHRHMASEWVPPTRDGRTRGIDRRSGLAWAVEAPEVHWAEHDVRLVAYWRSRPAAERLAEAAAYRVRVHGLVAAPALWTWQLVPAGRDAC